VSITPASTLRAARAGRAGIDEGYIRGYSASIENGAVPKEFEIELKYFDGQPAIREITRVSKPGRRVYSSIKDLEPRAQRSGHLDPVDAQGRDVRQRRP
jgi:small subunit ribosomal protein S8